MRITILGASPGGVDLDILSRIIRDDAAHALRAVDAFLVGRLVLLAESGVRNRVVVVTIALELLGVGRDPLAGDNLAGVFKLGDTLAVLLAHDIGVDDVLAGLLVEADVLVGIETGLETLRRDLDGAGGHGGGREASQTAAATVNEMANRYLLQSGSALAYVLNAANERICENAAAGYSTGVLAKEIDRNGRRMMAYAMVGDSRLYVVHQDGSVEQVTKDEGYENVITNALGNPVGPGEGRTRQFGEFDIHDGDRFVLCSDGITGDKGTDLMSNEELGRIVMSSRSAREASLNLVNNARKKDDRTAIVFGL